MSKTPEQQFTLSLNLKIHGINNINVIHATCQDSLSQSYHCQIEAYSTDLNLTTEHIQGQPATLSFHTQEQANQFSGYILSAKTLQITDNYIRYQFELGPKLSFLKLQTHHRAYANVSITELIAKLLTPYDIKYQLQLTNDYSPLPILHQYNESDFEFLSRHLERLGIYYYFKPSNEETIIFTDHRDTHVKSSQAILPYFNIHALNMATLFPHISEFTRVNTLCPREIKLHSYQPRQAECFVTAHHQIDNKGIGEHSEYCEAVQSQHNLNQLAKLRAQEIYSKHHYFSARSTILHIRPGQLYTLKNHPQTQYNQDYLVCEVHHYIQQNLKNNPIIGLDLSNQSGNYYNTLVLRKSTQQYRPPLITPIPRIQGIVHAHVSHDTNTNPLDHQGWYQVRLGFNDQGKAWLVRKSEPYSGKNHGMHFPLQAGTEVLLSFVQGHPESPIITGSGFNSQDVNLVTENNSHDHSIRTARNAEFTLSDHPKHAHIRLKQPGYKQYIKQQPITITTQETSNTITDTQITKDEAQVSEGFGNWKYELVHGTFGNNSKDQTRNDYATYLEETPLKLHIFGGPNSTVSDIDKIGINNLKKRNQKLISSPDEFTTRDDLFSVITEQDIKHDSYTGTGDKSEFLAVENVIASYADLYKDCVKAEEIYGKKYTLISGNSTSVHKGNSNHKHHGNSTSKKSGDSHNEINSVSHISHTNTHITKYSKEAYVHEGKASAGIKTTIHEGLDSQTTVGLYQRNYLGIYNTIRLVSNDNILKKKDSCVWKSDTVLRKEEVADDKKTVTIGKLTNTMAELILFAAHMTNNMVNRVDNSINEQATAIQRIANTQNEIKQGLSETKTLANTAMTASTLAAVTSAMIVFS